MVNQPDFQMLKTIPTQEKLSPRPLPTLSASLTNLKFNSSQASVHLMHSYQVKTFVKRLKGNVTPLLEDLIETALLILCFYKLMPVHILMLGLPQQTTYVAVSLFSGCNR